MSQVNLISSVLVHLLISFLLYSFLSSFLSPFFVSFIPSLVDILFPSSLPFFFLELVFLLFLNFISGSGVSLYFQFAKSASVCFFVMTIFAIPSLILSYYGSKISLQNRDAIGLYRFTIGTYISNYCIAPRC